ncbi:MAG TPA: DUF445 domain-containing protein [Aromatoleum sp.]|uniref:DUF445 domain-containing protein n=1 Tax=Aromatoleum sp. TaxID=2307007 RepID=UPI002B498FE0|nr:DUF445 domain-containing protein [Aromatoleum sp.]HJV25605.1 DUF445 domain-containing protein [Aromatoleum sp.]
MMAFTARDAKAHQLTKMKRLAGALLAAAAALFVLARLQHGAGIWGWVAAFAEAAMIGALADWFAVVALFRRPLGLPIPHTAIIPSNKARVADNLAAFVRDKFLATETLVHKLRAFDPADRLGAWLRQPDNAALVADKLAAALAGWLDFIDDARVRSLIAAGVRERLKDIDVSRVAGQVLDTLTVDNRHQELLDLGLRRLARWLDDEEVQASFATMIIEIAGKEYPKTLRAVGLVTDTEEFALKIAASIVKGVNGWMHDIGDDPEHPRRRAFDDMVAEFIERLKTDEDFAARINAAKLEILTHPVLAHYLNGLWDELKAWLNEDLERPESRLRQRLAGAASAFGATLADNPALRTSLDDHLESAVVALADDFRDALSLHIASTVKSWNDDDLVREVELAVGRDLQFIRLNGTVVGGGIGLALHALTVLVSRAS